MSIGEAAVEIVGDTSRFGESVKQGIKGNITSAAATAAKAVAGIGLAVAGVGVTLTGLAIKGGISRALNIEDAQAKLRGLGHDAKSIETIMGSALDAVRGTAFGLGDAASVAATAVASGIAPGEELTRTLKLMADAAFIANSDLTEMGPIFNKVAAGGKLTTEVMNQLQDRGIPVLTRIAEEYGITAEAAQKMVTEGKISFEDFQTVMEGTLGGAAQSSGETVRGAFANMGAAMSRWGAEVVGPLLPLVRDVFGGMTAIWDRLTAATKPLMAAFAGSDVFARLSETAKDLPGLFDRMLEAISPLTDTVLRLWGAFQEGEGIIGGLKAVFDELTAGEGLSGMFDGLVEIAQSAFSGLVDWLTSGGAAMIVTGILEGRAKLLDAALQLFPVILDGLIKFLPSLLAFITGTLLPQVVNLITTAVPQLTAAAVQLFSALVSAITTILPPLLSALTGTVIPALVTAITTMLPVILQAAVTLFQGLIAGLITVLPILLDALANNVIPALLGLIVEAVPLILEAAVSLFTALIDGILEVLPVLLDTLLGTVLPDLLTTIVDMVPEILTAAVTAFTALIDALVQILPGLIGTLLGTVLPSLVTNIVGMLPQILEAAITAFLALVDGVLEVLPDIINVLLNDVLPALVSTIIEMAPELFTAAVTALWEIGKALLTDVLPKLITALGTVAGDIIGAVVAIGGDLFTAGKEIFNRLWDGMKEVWNSIASWFEGRLDWLTGLWPFSPAKHGPLREKDPYTAGRNIVNLLAEGMRSAGGALDSAGLAVAAGIAGAISIESNEVVNHGRELVKKLVDGMSAEARKSKDAVQTVKDSVMKSIGTLVKDEMDRLKSARQELSNLRRSFTSMRESVAGSIAGELDLRGVARAEGRATFQDVAKSVTGLVTRAKTFAGLLKKLRLAGFPAGLIQEVAGLGTKDGIEIARALMSGTEGERKDLIADWANLESFTDKAGKQVAKATFDVALAAQKGLVEGLKTSTRDLKEAAKVLAKNLAKWIKEELGIKSPSLVFKEIGQDMAAGMAQGILSGVGAVRAAASELLDAAVRPRALSPVSPLALAASPMGGGVSAAPAPVFRIDSVRVEIHGDVTREKAREAGVTAAEAMLERLSTSRVVA